MLDRDEPLSKTEYQKLIKKMTPSHKGTKRTDVVASSTSEPDKKRKKTATLFGVLSAAKHRTSLAALQRACVCLAGDVLGSDVEVSVAHVRSKIPAEIDASAYEKDIYPESNDADGLSAIQQFFGDATSVRNWLARESESMSQTDALYQLSGDGGPQDAHLVLDAIRGHLDSLEKSAATSGRVRLSDWIALALSPMGIVEKKIQFLTALDPRLVLFFFFFFLGGKDLWLRAMEKQAKSLEAEGHARLAATCYLACARVYEAVRVCRAASLLSEALAIARLRLPSSDSIIGDLFAEYGELLKLENKDEMAAMW